MVRTPLDLLLTQEFAQTILGEQRHPNGQLAVEHAAAVAEVTCNVMRTHFRTQRGWLSPDAVAGLELLQHAAWLHEAIERGPGCLFETVCHETNPQVAELVSAVTRDNRLAQPRRLMDLQSRMVEAPLPSQVLLLCDILCELEATSDWAAAAPAQDRDEIVLELWPGFEGELEAVQRLSRWPAFAKLLVHGDEQLTTLVASVRSRIRERQLAARIQARQNKLAKPRSKTA